jgi:hypothetical protein
MSVSGMESDGRDFGFDEARRNGLDDLAGLDLSAHRQRFYRRRIASPIAIMVLSAVAGASAAWIVTSKTQTPQTTPQSLVELPSASPVPDVEVAGVQLEFDENAQPRPGDRKDRIKNVTVRIKPKRSAPSRTSAPSYYAGVPSQPAPPSGAKDPAPEPKPQPQKPEAEPFEWPKATLYHLFRKRDKQHYYTVSASEAEVRRTGDGYKDRLSPGYVYTRNKYPKKLIPVSMWPMAAYVYVFRVDQGAETVPLYRLSRRGGANVMYTSWEDIRASWIEKGWTDHGYIGFIYRP